MRRLLAGALTAWTALALAADDAPLSRFAAQVEAAYPNTPTLAVDSFLALASRPNFVIVDARAPEERAVSIIPGAITLQQLAPDHSKPVLVYCTIGMRSAAVTRELREQGFEAFNLRGGILAWAAAEQTFVDTNGEPTHRVHVYGRRWNYLPSGLQPVW